MEDLAQALSLIIAEKTRKRPWVEEALIKTGSVGSQLPTLRTTVHRLTNLPLDLSQDSRIYRIMHSLASGFR